MKGSHDLLSRLDTLFGIVSNLTAMVMTINSGYRRLDGQHYLVKPAWPGQLSTNLRAEASNPLQWIGAVMHVHWEPPLIHFSPSTLKIIQWKLPATANQWPLKLRHTSCRKLSLIHTVFELMKKIHICKKIHSVKASWEQQPYLADFEPHCEESATLYLIMC